MSHVPGPMPAFVKAFFIVLLVKGQCRGLGRGRRWRIEHGRRGFGSLCYNKNPKCKIVLVSFAVKESDWRTKTSLGFFTCFFFSFVIYERPPEIAAVCFGFIKKDGQKPISAIKISIAPNRFSHLSFLMLIIRFSAPSLHLSST